MNIRETGKNKYRVEIYDGTDARGKARRYTKVFHATTKRELKSMIKEWEKELERSRSGYESITVSELCEEVWSQVIQEKSPNTIRGYDVCRKRIETGLGSVTLAKLSPRLIQKWINSMADELAPKTVKSTYSLLRRCCTVACNWEILDRNPCHDIILPTKERQEVRILSEDEFRIFCDHLPELDPDTRVLFELALFCSLRRGEIMGITENQIDDSGRFYLEAARYRIREGNEFTKSVKTAAGKRMVMVPEFVLQDIHELRKYHAAEKQRLGDLWQDCPYLIKATDGSPFRPNESNRRLHQYMERIGLEPLTFHALRHTYASMCVAFGADLATVSRRMGHSNVSTTLSIYTHLFEKQSDQDPIASQFDEMVHPTRVGDRVGNEENPT